MGPFIIAWLVGEGIISYRSVKKNHAPPGPGELLLSSGLFVMLGLLAESSKLRSLAVSLAWGFDVAAFLNLFNLAEPKGTGKWPPDIAPNTVVIPTGTTTTESNGGGSGSGSGGSGGNGGTQSGPPIQNPPPGLGL